MHHARSQFLGYKEVSWKLPVNLATELSYQQWKRPKKGVWGEMLRNWSTKDPKFHRFTPSQFLGFNVEHVRCRIPKAKIMALSLKGGHDGCCVCETGNPTKNMISASFANISRQLWRVLSWILWGFSPEFREGRGSLLSCFFFGSKQTRGWFPCFCSNLYQFVRQASLLKPAALWQSIDSTCAR